MYKAIVIGGGPGGYVAAIRLSQLGFKVALLEKNNLGGTCTNLGCIPTKALLTSAHFYHDIIAKSKKFGINVENVQYDTKELLKHMKKSITLSKKGVEYLLKKNGIDFYNDTGIIISKNKIKLEKSKQILEAENLILAQGSKPIIFPPFDTTKGLWTSDDVFRMTEIPNSILIIGGGVIGVEFASLFSYLGKKVFLVELFDHILPSEDSDVAELIKKSLEKNGVSVFEKSKVDEIIEENGKFISAIGNETIKTDKVILAVGRMTNISSDIKDLGIEIDKKGIVVNDKMETSIKNIYAIGDITGRYMLAHVAMKEGIVAAENIGGKEKRIDYSAVPSIIFSNPEVASTGMKERDVKDKEFTVFKFPLSANARATTLAERDGFVKVIKENKSDRIMGISIISPVSTEMISIGTVGVQLKLKIEDLIKSIFPHPTLSESIMEAFEGSENKSIHI